jgi:NAD(P)-dependent dehydrogenase (short-subunit alcohol dehydrogenase family)
MKAVLVTGASTGIGRKITERLAADGYFVYASARNGTARRAGERDRAGVFKSDIFKNEVQRSGTGAQVLDYASHAKDPDEVAAAVERALFEPNPKHPSKGVRLSPSVDNSEAAPAE